MGIVERYLMHKVTWWTTAPDGFGGYTFSAPIVLDGRWTSELQKSVDANGAEIVSKAQVILSADVDVGDYLYEGETNAADPTTVGASEVKNFLKVTDLRNLNVFRKAIL